MATLHLIEGPVGAGKSTYAAAMAAQTSAVHIALDAWFAALFSPDRPATDVVAWYLDRKQRLIDLIWTHSLRLLASGSDVWLELGLIQRQHRAEFCRKVRDSGTALVVHVLDAAHDVRRERVRQRNVEQGPTFAMIVPDPAFELASRLWEAPDADECDEVEVRFVDAH